MVWAGRWLLASVIVGGAPAILRACRRSIDPAPDGDRHDRAAARAPAPGPAWSCSATSMLDVVLAPARPLEVGTDVPGRVAMVQGGSAANTARWLGRLGRREPDRAVGRDAAGRALVEAVQCRRRHRPGRRGSPGVRTGRIGVLCRPDGERSFVADRGAADRLAPDDLRPAWFEGADALHLPVYSLLGEPLGLAGRRAIELARAAGAIVSVDLASIGPLLAEGRRTARALIADGCPGPPVRDRRRGRGAPRPARRRGPARVRADRRRQARGEGRDRADPSRRATASASRSRRVHLPVTDTTGAGDAFDAGFLVGWFAARDRRSPAGGLAPASGARRPSGGRAAAVDAARRSCRPGEPCPALGFGGAQRPPRHRPRGRGRAGGRAGRSSRSNRR